MADRAEAYTNKIKPTPGTTNTKKKSFNSSRTPASKKQRTREKKGYDYRAMNGMLYSMEDDGTWTSRKPDFYDSEKYSQRGQSTFGINLSPEKRHKRIEELKKQGQWEWRYK